ncbi:26236c00-dad7-45a0-9524-6831cabe8e89 [Sclerotinia trifoliorum]|uniref:Defective in cullin neddylation protein n=1 Tax=Sclerotinia trifoliorum TaxID=28548 RepID=A0A8H2VT77_9HELO|nr:26236c00-dad7-45a0-9524-6831cabe8e89 [Sclerotinia trifoliorum]
MPLTGSQRSMLNEFMQITGISERNGTKILKGAGWRLEAACDSFFQANHNAVPSAQAKEKETLTKLFESYRTFSDDVDMVGVDGTMKYFGDDLGVNLEGVEFLIPCEIIQVPSIGEMSKEGFVEGWKKLGLDTIPKQKSHISKAVASLSTDSELFKRVYKHTFVCAREKGQKALSLELASVYWELLFNAPGRQWKTNSTNWIALWLEFLGQNWKKSVNKDLWNQTYQFHAKTMEDESLSFWNEDGAWPSVIDEFVAWVKKNRGDPEAGETMETD